MGRYSQRLPERGRIGIFNRSYYEEVLVVPADNKWFTRLVVAAAIVDALERLDLTYPKVDDAKLKALAAARKALAAERE